MSAGYNNSGNKVNKNGLSSSHPLSFMPVVKGYSTAATTCCQLLSPASFACPLLHLPSQNFPAHQLPAPSTTTPRAASSRPSLRQTQANDHAIAT